MKAAPSFLCCLECGAAELEAEGHGLCCRRCRTCVDVVAGIPDLRPALAGFDHEADRALALELDSVRTHLGFDELLHRYWAAHPEVCDRFADAFVRGDLLGADRAREVMSQVEDEVGAGSVDVPRALEVGCGTAALGSVLAGRAGHVVVSDVALAWLVLACHRMEQAGIQNVSLVACTADRLPFPDDTFDLVVAADVIEHVPDARAFAVSCHRVLRPPGSMWLATPNRFSLTAEPHVRLWGVGFLPRATAEGYVRRVRGISYEEIHTLSRRRLARTLERTGGQVEIVAPPIVTPVKATHGHVGRALIAAYNVALRLPAASRVLGQIAPLFHAVVRKKPVTS